MLAPFETTSLADDEQEVSVIKNTDNISKSENMGNRVRINNESKIIVLITKLVKFCVM